ncbi:Dihydrolipoyllysine-residue succinyltransferase component of 2-oxoglutarate dehydrogenase complex, mitochondrial [Lamellibrachia satsuma]|nr:Dihydrolipoyllysine-residue succinyltransferase component of 2-oxoglutarate dehydrogenase complex, mitochondrial [Lamellibrachia satsuma]
MAAVMLCASRYAPRRFISHIANWFQLTRNKPAVPYATKQLANAAEYIRNPRNGLQLLKSCERRHVIPYSLGSRCFHSSRTLWDEEIKVVKTPQFADSITEGDVRWDKAVGDFVKEDENVGEIETDKMSIGLPAPVSGIIEELLAEDGATVQAGQDIYKLRVTDAAPAGSETPAKSADAPPPPPPAAAEPAPPPPPAAAAPSAPGPIPTAPPPVPPLPAAPMTSKPTSSVKVMPAMPTGVRSEHRVKMTRIRQRIAQRLKEAQSTCAMLTTFNEIDMSNIMGMRTKYKDAFLKKHGIKLGFMSAFVRACSYALENQPVVNAVIDEKEIVYRDYVDISVAVATPRGLVVPVLRDVQAMNYADIELGLAALGEKARKDDLAIEDMDGGTFTISNGGVFGSMFGTPIINPPQSAILGMHGIFDRPVAIDGKVEVRPMMYVALTYDHRLIDGREAVVFLRTIKSAVEDPQVLLLDI